MVNAIPCPSLLFYKHLWDSFLLCCIAIYLFIDSQNQLNATKSRNVYDDSDSDADELSVQSEKHRNKLRQSSDDMSDDDEELMGKGMGDSAIERKARDREKAEARAAAKAEAREKEKERQREKEEKLRGPPMGYEEAKGLQLRRDAIVRLLDKPYLEEYVTGLLVRVNDRPDENGIPQYRCARVVAVVPSSKEYKVDRVPVKKAIKIRYGDVERVFPISVISTQTISMGEWDKFQGEMERAQAPLPSAKRAKDLQLEKETLRRTFVMTQV